MTVSVIVIGTEPPCPRCALMGSLVTKAAEESGISVALDHISFDSPRAREIAQRKNLIPGTAKHVLTKVGIEVGMHEIYALIENPPPTSPYASEVDGIAARWSPELDEALRPCEKIAESVGILMTPVLIVDGEIRHAGSVPGFQRIREYLHGANS
ncbi:MAG: hypothetical protein GF401_07770 [Chitinivibrionales bacterium]|nr:hypothetical protein [Chitinivibrionales bacterium]